MGSNRRLININAYVDGQGYLGEISEFGEPKLAMETDDYRGGGMLGKVKQEMGLDAMEATLTMGGHVASLVRKFGSSTRIRLVAAYKADDGTAAQAVEIYLGGKFNEIDFGTASPGAKTEHKYTAQLTYYRRVVDGQDEIEIDMLAGTFIVAGVDLYGDIMSILTG